MAVREQLIRLKSLAAAQLNCQHNFVFVCFKTSRKNKGGGEGVKPCSTLLSLFNTHTPLAEPKCNVQQRLHYHHLLLNLELKYPKSSVLKERCLYEI